MERGWNFFKSCWPGLPVTVGIGSWNFRHNDIGMRTYVWPNFNLLPILLLSHFMRASWGRHWYPSILITQKCFLKLLACLACHGWYRELKFSSHRHRYVDLYVTKFQPLANTPSIPFHEGVMRATSRRQGGDKAATCGHHNRHGIEGVLARGWNLVTHKFTYLLHCDANFSFPYQLWQASQANIFKKAVFSFLVGPKSL